MERVGLEQAVAAESKMAIDVLDVHEALEKLTTLDPKQAQVVELKYFGGLDMPTIAEVLAVSVTTVEREWRAARAWLAAKLEPEGR